MKINNQPLVVQSKETSMNSKYLEKTKIVKQWAKKMNVAKLYDGIKQKELMINTICSKYKVKPEELAYIGDDINDIELLKRVGFLLLLQIQLISQLILRL